MKIIQSDSWPCTRHPQESQSKSQPRMSQRFSIYYLCFTGVGKIQLLGSVAFSPSMVRARSLLTMSTPGSIITPPTCFTPGSSGAFAPFVCVSAHPPGKLQVLIVVSEPKRRNKGGKRWMAKRERAIPFEQQGSGVSRCHPLPVPGT